MTLCQVSFRCSADLNEHQLSSLERLKGQLYGLRGFSIDSAHLVVTYDASRLSVADVETALHRAGVPATR